MKARGLDAKHDRIKNLKTKAGSAQIKVKQEEMHAEQNEGGALW